MMGMARLIVPGLPVIRPESMASAEITSYKPTSRDLGSALVRSGEAFKKSVSLGAQLLLQPRRAVAIAAGPGFSAIEIAAVAPVMRTHGGRVARGGLPAAPEDYRTRARAVHLRLSWARIPQQRAALSPRLQPCCGAVRAIRYVRGHRIPSLA